MRIISGEFGGRHFYPPAKKWPTRPTTDISKEGLFNILNNRLDFETLKVLDIFGGTGNHSIEFISRGVKEVHYVDRHRPCVKFISKLAEEWGFAAKIKIHNQDAFYFIKKCSTSYNYIFAGPPYPLVRIPEIPNLIFEANMLEDDGLFVLEHNSEHSFKKHPRFSEERTYGGTYFSFFE